MNTFSFNNRLSSDFGILISGEGAFDAPELDYEVEEIPGRNGNLIFSNNRYKNIKVSYPAIVHDDFSLNATAVRAWLLSPRSYCRLQDSYHPDEYRMALFSGPISFKPRFLNHSADIDFIFDCKPQRFLVSGDQSVICTSGQTIYNPTAFDSLPIIELTGTGAGVLTIGQYTVNVLSLSNLIIDCDTQNAYYGVTNLNSTISCLTFPKLVPGNTLISWSGNITSVKITPRWWTI